MNILYSKLNGVDKAPEDSDLRERERVGGMPGALREVWVISWGFL